MRYSTATPASSGMAPSSRTFFMYWRETSHERRSLALTPPWPRRRMASRIRPEIRLLRTSLRKVSLSLLYTSMKLA
ncbi:MAG: hypothetical protein U5L11_12480 [Arhodomonas sp.]|nr:hypothetical protein [Arhodomonas sp.]